MFNVIIGSIIAFLMMLILYLAPAVLLHAKCGLPGINCVQVPTALVWLFWCERHDRLRNPFGIFVQVGAIVGAMLVVAVVLTPLESSDRRLLATAAFIVPFIVIGVMNVIYQVIRRL